MSHFKIQLDSFCYSTMCVFTSLLDPTEKSGHQVESALDIMTQAGSASGLAKKGLFQMSEEPVESLCQ